MGRDLSKELKFQLDNAGYSGYGDSLANNSIRQAVGNLTAEERISQLMQANQAMHMQKMREASEGNYGLLGAMSKGGSEAPGGVYIGKDTEVDNKNFQAFNKKFIDKYGKDNLPVSGGTFDFSYITKAFENDAISITWKTEAETGESVPFIKFGNTELSGDIMMDAEYMDPKDFIDKYGFSGGDTPISYKDAPEFVEKFIDSNAGKLLNEYLPYIVSEKEWRTPSALERIFGDK